MNAPYSFAGIEIFSFRFLRRAGLPRNTAQPAAACLFRHYLELVPCLEFANRKSGSSIRAEQTTTKYKKRYKSSEINYINCISGIVRWDRRFWTERNCRNSSKTRCRCLAPKEHTSSSSTCGRGHRRRLPSNGLLGPQEWSMTFELFLLYFRGRIASTHEDTPIEVVSTKHLTTVVLQRDIFRTAPNSGCIFLSIMLN